MVMPSPKEAFELDPTTGEPFLRLPKPLNKIIITPPRLSDTDTIIKYLNDPPIYKSLDGVPHPYTYEHGVEWQTMIKGHADSIWEQIKQSDSDGRHVFDGCPVRCIREINDDGSQTFLGDCGITRWNYPDVTNKAEQEKLTKENREREVGDPKIIWMIGGNLGLTVLLHVGG